MPPVVARRSLDVFFGGLETLLGPPQMVKDPEAPEAGATLLMGMKSEHVLQKDAHEEFTSSSALRAAAIAASCCRRQLLSPPAAVAASRCCFCRSSAAAGCYCCRTSGLPRLWSAAHGTSFTRAPPFSP